MNRRTESYWEKRSINRISAAEKRSIPYIKQVQRVYRKAAKDTIESVRAMYRAYYKNDKTFDMDALNGIAPQGDVKRFLAQMKAKGLSTYLPDNYKGRMTRLELINAQIWGEVKKASASEKIATTELYEKVFENSYYQTGFDMAKGLGENIAFSTLDKATVEKVLSQKFEGEDFSNRIWNNTDRLANQLTEIMAKAIATGASVERTSREFRERFGVGVSNATRLVRTETCYFENSAELAAYAEMGIEEFVFVATLDSRTSDICQSMDGQKFKMSKAMVGENVPPLHPNCRSTIVAYLGKEYEPETRIYRDEESGKNLSIHNMSYSKWRKSIEVEETKQEKLLAKNVGVSYKYWKQELNLGEKNFIRNFPEKIKWINRNVIGEDGKKKPTNDFVWENKEYELKTIAKTPKYRTIVGNIESAAKKGKTDFMIDFGERALSDKLSDKLSKYNVLHDKKIDSLTIFSKGEIIRIDLKK